MEIDDKQTFAIRIQVCDLRYRLYLQYCFFNKEKEKREKNIIVELVRIHDIIITGILNEITVN